MEGMILIASALLKGNPNSAKKEITDAVDCSLGRCCSYHNTIQAIAPVINAL